MFCMQILRRVFFYMEGKLRIKLAERESGHILAILVINISILIIVKYKLYYTK